MSKITLKRFLPFLLLVVIAIAAIFIPSLPASIDDSKYNPADITWLLVATALVFIMTPGLAFFYGGMGNRKKHLFPIMKKGVAGGGGGGFWIFFWYRLFFVDFLHVIILILLTQPFF